jgi:lysophospholipase L1-like esterase
MALPIVFEGRTGAQIAGDVNAELGALGAEVEGLGARAGSIIKPPLSNIMAVQIHGNIEAAAQTATNFCYHMTIVIPADAKRFRVALDNASTTLPFRIASGAIATSDSIGADPTFGSTTGQVRVTPQNGTGWTAITWAAGAGVEIAAAASAGMPRRVWSDWVTCPTVENTDGSNRRVVMIRFWVEGTTSSPGNGYCTSFYSQAWRVLAADTALHDGYLWQCVRSTVNGVATPASFTPATDLKNKPFLTSLEYETYVPGLTLTAFGDSQVAGAVNGADTNFGQGWLWQLLKNLRARYPGTPIDLANAAVAGASTTTYEARSLDYISTAGVIGLPVYQPFSQNDGAPSAESYAASWVRAENVFAALLARTSAAPVLTTPMPNTSLAWTGPQDAIRLAKRAELMALRSSGRAVVDYEVVSDGATPARYVAAWTTDNAHPNAKGHAVISKGAIAQISLAGV